MDSIPNLVCRLGKVVILALATLGTCLYLIENSTTDWVNKPVSRAYAHPEPHLTTTVNFVGEPLNSGFITAIPSSDGSELFVTVSGVPLANTNLTLNIDPSDGPAGHRCGHAMVLSDTVFIATAGGFAPGKDIGDDGDNTLSITGTIGTNNVDSGDINFLRAFVQPATPETIVLDEGNFELKILNAQSVLADTYLVAMSTNAPPSAAPQGYQFIGQTYTIRPSGSLTASEKPMTLNLAYPQILPAGVDPQMLTILRWDGAANRWVDMGGKLLTSQSLVSLATDLFGIYGLAAGPAWRDSFETLSLSGLSVKENVQWGPGQTVILNTGTTTGTAVSQLITPMPASEWGQLHFSASLTINNNLTVDLLDSNNNLVLADLADGADLAALGVQRQAQPSLKLRATFSRATALDDSPALHRWQLSWQPFSKFVYLPTVAR